MKMMNPELEVVRFGAEDVIATSDGLHMLSSDGTNLSTTCNHSGTYHYLYDHQGFEDDDPRYPAYFGDMYDPSGDTYLSNNKSYAINPEYFETGSDAPVQGEWFWGEEIDYVLHFRRCDGSN